MEYIFDWSIFIKFWNKKTIRSWSLPWALSLHPDICFGYELNDLDL